FSGPTDFVVTSFAGDDWKACKDYVKDRLGIAEGDYQRSDGLHRKAFAATLAAQLAVEKAERTAQQRAKALEVWRGVRPLLGTVAEAYLVEARAIPGGIVQQAVEAGNLAFHPALSSLFGVRSAFTYPALVARAVDPFGEFVGIHATFLESDGSGKIQKKMLGAGFMGASVRLGSGPQVVLAEGLETALSAGHLLGLSPVAALSAGGVEAWRPWDGVESVTLGVDVDKSGTGQKAAEAAAISLTRLGARVAGFAMAPDNHKDFNDTLRARAGKLQEAAQ
ncbi:MAG: toprim domain-containing protein, partial [Aquidulcibacter sp.]|uniref:DUF7146 domain-containing protein n=1 Tax=Aquidulcibacter sp. TaxID=2052990 RepID=UPI0022C65C02|nr:toprim domain-containing protein [Aquidulcibacter sp.]